MKPKINRSGDTGRANKYDDCQTPPYAIVPILPYIQKLNVWDSAAGKGRLAWAMWKAGIRDVLTSDIGEGLNFFEYQPESWGVQVTNPPYSIKYQWLKRSYELNHPFALLLPVETLGASKAQKLFKKYGVQIMFLDQRVDFEMPDAGFSGKGAQFPVMWVTWRLGLPLQMNYGSFDGAKERFKLQLLKQTGETK